MMPHNYNKHFMEYVGLGVKAIINSTKAKPSLAVLLLLQ